MVDLVAIVKVLKNRKKKLERELLEINRILDSPELLSIEKYLNKFHHKKS